MDILEEAGLTELNDANLHEVNGGIVDIGNLLNSLLGEDGLLSGLIGSLNELIDGVLGSLPTG